MIGFVFTQASNTIQVLPAIKIYIWNVNFKIKKIIIEVKNEKNKLN